MFGKKWSIVVYIIAAVAVIFLNIKYAHAEETAYGKINSCTSEVFWKTLGVGALYGGGLMLVGSSLTVAFSPAGAIAAPVAFIADSTLTGSLVGLGSTAVSQIYQLNKTGISSAEIYCTKKYAVDTAEELAASAKKFGNDSYAKAEKELDKLMEKLSK